MANKPTNVILKGGEDLVSSGVEIDPGRAQLLHNYVCSQNGGYAKVPGYVAYDGRDVELTYSAGNGTRPADGDTVTIGSVTSELEEITVTSGSWAGGDAAGVITVSNVRGAAAPSTGTATFETASSSICTVSAVSAPAVVPGDGEIKGIWVWDDKVYAVRSDGELTPKDILYVASASGWTAAPIGYKIAFTAGGGGVSAPVPVRGDVLTQGGVTATISGVSITSGNFETDGDAVGFLHFDVEAGGSFAAGAATYGTGSDAITLSAIAAANALGDGVKYEFRNENFSADAGDYLMYFVNGVENAWEYDGVSLVAIKSGASPDTPNHLETHGQRLWISLPGGNIFFSSPGSPTTGFTQDYSAGSVAVGDECTGMSSLPGGVLAIFGERRTKILSGSISGTPADGGDMQLKDHAKNIGAKEWTIKTAMDTYFLSDFGATSLYQTDKFGSFAGSTLSTAIEPLIKTYIPYAIESIFMPANGIWRIFFDDETASSTPFLSCAFSGGRMIGWSRGNYEFKLSATCMGNIYPNEVYFAGSEDGWVYQLETGTSFNGAAYRTGMILPYNAMFPSSGVLVDKQWRKTIFQLDSASGFDFSYAFEFNYSKLGWPSQTGEADTAGGGGMFWGAGIWNTFTWSGNASYGVAELDTFGVGFNMAIIITTNSNSVPTHTMRAYSSIYEERRLVH